jgi:hypothetical protein
MRRLLSTALGLFLVGTTASVSPAQFAAKGNQNAGGWTALGAVVLNVGAPFQGAFANLYSNGYLPGWTDNGGGQYRSPLLYDSSAIVGNSDPILQGSNAETNGVAVGTANTNVSSGSLTYPGAFTNTAGAREEFLQVVNLNMSAQSNGVSLLMGSSAPKQSKATLGEIQSLSNTANPTNDFPAQSFFDVFAEIDLPIGNDTAQLTNSSPLMYYGNNVSSVGPLYPLNPFVPTAVPLYFAGDFTPLGAFSGDQLGTYTILSYGTQVPEPSMVGILVLSGVGLMGRRRGKAVAL